MKRRKMVLIGAGSAVFTQGLVADFIMNKELGPWEIALVDIDEKVLNSITKLTKKMVEQRNADIIITSSINRREVLSYADVVVTTIAVGGRRSWEADVQIPRKYGIYQPVGDTSMPGGISRALRMIPVMLEIGRDVQELCPQAYFFNYSNPMTAITTALLRELNLPVVGLCHGVIHVEQYLARFIQKPYSEVTSLGVGLNHLTFMYDLRVKGENAWPLVDEVLNKQKAKSTDTSPKTDSFAEMGGEEDQTPFYGDNPFSWEFYEENRVFPAVLDRHVVEFFPERFRTGEYYGQKLGVNAFSFESVIAEGDKIYEEMFEKANGEMEMDQKLFERTEGEHEQLVEILLSLYADKRKVFSVNLMNNGSVPNLPSNAVLEMPAVATGRGFMPLSITDLPENLAEILRKRIHVIDLTVDAALKGDKELFIKALLEDGSVTDRETAVKLAEELLEAHKEFLPNFFEHSDYA